MNTLEKIGGLSASDLFLNNTAETTIEAVRTEALAMVFDTTTAKGRDECISWAAKVTKTKTGIEKLGKALVDPIKAEAKVIDKERKLYRDELEAIKAEVRKPVTLWEEEQAAAKAKVDQHFFELEQAGVSTSSVTGELLSEVQLSKKIAHLESINLEDFGDRSEDAEQMTAAGLTRIKAALQQRKDADELDELRKAKAKQEAADARAADEKRIADEAVAKHEAAKKEAAESKVAPVVVAKNESVSKRDSEAIKKVQVNRQLLESFCLHGMLEADAKRLIGAIVNNKIPNIQITY